MGNNIDRLFQKWDEFQQTHTRIYSPELRSLVFSLYDRLQLELEGEAVFTLKDEGSMTTITISAESFLSDSQFPTLQQLIREADTFEADIQDDKIVFELLFVFWNWVPNQ